MNSSANKPATFFKRVFLTFRHILTQRKYILTYMPLLTLALLSTGYFVYQHWMRTSQGPASVETRAFASEEKSLKEALPVNVAKIHQQQAYETQRLFTGTVHSRNSTSLSFEISGKIKQWHVEEGQSVKATQVLAELDTEKIKVEKTRLDAIKQQAQARLDELENGPRQEQIKQAREQVNLSQQRLIKAQLTYDRVLKAHEVNASTDYERDLADLEVKAWKAQLSLHQAQLEELQNGTREEHIRFQKAEIARIQSLIDDNELRLKDAKLIAPFTGRLTQRQASEGAIIQPGQSLIHLESTKHLEARISVPIHILDELDMTQSQNLVLGGQEFKSSMTRHLPALDQQTRSAVLIFNLPELSQTALIGRTIQLKLTQRFQVPGFYVPTQALHPDEHGLWYIQVLTQVQPEGPWKLERRYVEIIRTEAQRVYLKGPLKEGDLLIPDGKNRIAEDQAVVPVLLDSISQTQQSPGALISRNLDEVKTP